jgi:hypothetical protein
VARPREIFLDEQSIIAEGGPGFAFRAFDGRIEILGMLDNAHPLAAAAC